MSTLELEHDFFRVPYFCEDCLRIGGLGNLIGGGVGSGGLRVEVLRYFLNTKPEDSNIFVLKFVLLIFYL